MPVPTDPARSRKAAPAQAYVSAADASTLAPGVFLLPGPLRTDLYRLYHALRSLDDLVDGDHEEAEERVSALERWAAGEAASSPETVVLADLSSRRGLSREPLADFSLAMRHDMRRATVETEDDLERYCQRAGGAVGIMLAQIIGIARPDGEAKMAALGRAVQRTNILRDIDEDSAQGRVYIARTTIERFGPPVPGDRKELLCDQIAKADSLYDEALSATPIVSQGQRGLALSAALYREILRQIEREGYGRRAGRVVVPAWRRRLLEAKCRLSLRS